MDLADYDYALPDTLIARHPLAERSASRLLLVDPRQHRFEDRRFDELPALLDPGDLVVFNDTRVIPARLHGQKSTGGRVEILLERVTGEHTALAHIKASKTPSGGAEISLDSGFRVTVTARQGEYFLLAFVDPIAAVLAEIGEIPLPPYLGRAAEVADTERYQTVYAANDGAVAAPTAGLHFDAATFTALANRDIETARITLHVGAGTFQNLRPAQLSCGRLHAERVIVSAEAAAAIAATRARGGRVIAIGTTTVRSLESAWQDGAVRPYDGETDLFIRPGYQFRAIDVLLTNFHLPRSSLLMLVAAFCGRDVMLDAYRHAVREQYRFFSYGDCSLLFAANARVAR
ncbi:MAG: tRNA preQ1(34) S-adenosylmethionine ribosyltransferase-isomerase QueA [Pseudomonadota bacterium]